MTAVQDPETTETAVVRTYEAMSIDEALELVRAAERLGFGVILRNAERAEEEDTYSVEWTVEVFDEIPAAE
ncbi:hypothetical protein [Fodinicola acaciae]|uniref:hypothetical protein n=1 Tax=Fodinicola acaciae TaxID=2681555 RepID=UPI0013D5860F|nr:hypothetical protein [Fodinicola acaciae]